MTTHKMRGCRLRSGRFHEDLEQRLVLSGDGPTVVDVSVAGTSWTPAFIQYLNDNGLGTDGYSIPVGGLSQHEALPWININQIRVTFSQDVHVDASDLALTGVNQTQYAVSDFDYFPESKLAIWTLDSHLPTDRYGIRLNADGLDPITNLSGSALDGEWVNASSTYASGDGVAGGDFEFTFNVLPGDTTDLYGSAFVDYFDLIAVADAMFEATGDPLYDQDLDIYGYGSITSSHWEYIYNNLWNTLPIGQPFAAGAAPTTAGFDLLSIDDDAVDVAVSLFDAFEDADDPDSALTYTLVSNSDPTLFDTVSIDQALGTLTLNAADGVSGRAELVLSASDNQGLNVETKLTIDVDRENIAPSLTATTTNLGLGLWIIEGWVTDPDDELDPLFVTLIGLNALRASVAENGYFYTVVLLDPGEGHFIDAWTHDGTSYSNTVYLEIGWG